MTHDVCLQYFADINLDQDFVPFHDENFSHLQTNKMLENTNRK